MDRNNLKLKTISLNVLGIWTSEKRKSVFNCLIKQNSDICFLQKTYSTEDTENLWKSQWPGEIYFAHKSIHSCGVTILIRKGFDFELKSLWSDEWREVSHFVGKYSDITFLLITAFIRL